MSEIRKICRVETVSWATGDNGEWDAVVRSLIDDTGFYRSISAG